MAGPEARAKRARRRGAGGAGVRQTPRNTRRYERRETHAAISYESNRAASDARCAMPLLSLACNLQGPMDGNCGNNGVPGYPEF
jgi:hypothetical protein